MGRRAMTVVVAVAVLFACVGCGDPQLTTPVSPGKPAKGAAARGCPAVGRAAVIDRERQRAWLCENAIRLGGELPITTAWDQPRPGTYAVYAKDRVTTSTFGGRFSYLDHFVAFARGIHTGARVGFHAVPRSGAGAYFQPFDTVGLLERRGESSGCIRVLPHDALRIWNWLSFGDAVVVVS
ncbi:MAG TPA: L,D-transpeptidase [Acidimicrobiales bacterium]|nr:L,D-transpeptidase [Acidimicrobiales bacterium]